MKHIDSEVIVIDNASTDDSKSFFRGRFPGVQFVYNKKNVGFGKANNEAFVFAKGDYLLLLNPDTLIAEDSIEQCLSFIESKENKAVVGVRMIDGNGNFLPESKRSFPDPVTSMYKLFGLARLFPRSEVFAKYYLGHLDEKEINEVDVLAGAFMMIPREVLNEVKGFDEAFFMYGEDIDLSYRIQKAGFKNYYFPETTIVHFKGESTKKGSMNYVKMFYTAMSTFVKKHYGGSRAGFFDTFLQLGIGFRGFLSIVYRFLRWVSLPVLDVLLFLFSFWLVRRFWIAYLLPYLKFDNTILMVALPIFTIVYLVTSYFSGLYDKPYRPGKVYSAFTISSLVFFTVHALVRGISRFPRGVFLTSIFMSFVLTILMRNLLIKLKILNDPRRLHKDEIAIVGGTDEYNKVSDLLGEESTSEEVIGRIGPSEETSNPLGSFGDLGKILKSGVIKEIIFCKGLLTYKQIISTLEFLPKDVDAGFFVIGSQSVIRSIDKNDRGTYVDGMELYRLIDPSYQRQKRLVDILCSVSFIITSPVHFFSKRNSSRYFRNCFDVLSGKKTFIGYSGNGKGLPVLKCGVLGTTGFPKNEENPSVKVLDTADKLYALNYSVIKDIRLIYRGYKFI